MKKLAFLLLLLPVLLQAQQTYPVNGNGGNITATNASCVPGACIGITISNVTSISVVVTGTFSATLAVESSTDGSTFSSAGSNITSAGTTSYLASGVVLFRVRASAYTSGNAGVNITTSATGGGGTVTTVTGTSPIASSGGSAPAISCPTCLTTTTGVQLVASGTAALGTSAIASGACATVVTSTATGALTTDNLVADFNADPTGTTGYIPGAMLTIIKYITANTANFKVCNNTAGSITPSAVTLQWRVVR